MTRSASAEPPQTVDFVELERNVGIRYEIAALPYFFQRQRGGNTSADYKLRDDGTVAVIKKCRAADGKADEARGVARPADLDTSAKLVLTNQSRRAPEGVGR